MFHWLEVSEWGEVLGRICIPPFKVWGVDMVTNAASYELAPPEAPWWAVGGVSVTFLTVI